MVAYDPFSEEVMTDPLPVYRQLREEAPVYFIERYEAWALSRFEDIWACSSDPRFSAARGTTSSQLLTKVQPVTPMLNVMDPPDHSTLRVAIRPRFSRKAIRGMEGDMRAIVQDCIAKVRGRDTFDVMADLSSQLSVKVTCQAVGIPVSDGDMLSDLVWRFFSREEGVSGMTAAGLAAAESLTAYFGELVDERRRRADDSDDVVNLLRDIEIGGRKLTDEEIGSHLTLLIIGGSETFPKTLANAVRRFGEYPDQRARLVRDPGLIPTAYEESLRFDMPTQFRGRTHTEDVLLRGQTLRAGHAALFLYPSANRDDREFDDPDLFDIDRRPARSLSFGAGTHACLGLHVAKMEGRVCLEEILGTWPDYEVDLAGAERLRTEFVQGFASLPIRIGEAG
jgi:cytochrome P450